jgi:hypothetical protein
VLGKVTVVGAGSWATTVAAIAARSVPTTPWARRPEPGCRHRRPAARGVEMPMVMALEGAQAPTEVVPALIACSAEPEFEDVEQQVRTP